MAKVERNKPKRKYNSKSIRGLACFIKATFKAKQSKQNDKADLLGLLM